MKFNNLRFLIDVGVGIKVEEWLQEHGFDTNTIRNINIRMADKEILKLAVAEKRVVVTMDKDFGELIYNSKLPHSGVLLLRLEGANSDKKVEIVGNIVKNYADMLTNSFSVFKDGRLRIRK